MAQATLKATLEFDVKGEAELKKVKTQLKGIGDAGNKAAPGIEKSTKATSGLQSSIKGLIGAGLLIGAGKALLDFGRASITAASDVEEMRSKFDTVFRDLGPQVTAELDKFATAANRSTLDLQGFAATLQDTFVPLGFARDEAANMSVEIVKLAEDLASFNNLPTQQVVEDLQSALVGNTETLRKYGVVANQAAIDQEALALGLDFTKGRMDAQTKAAAIMSLTLKGTTDAQGDAIKTADSFANQMKGLEAATMELKVAIGEGLLPIMSKLAGAAADSARDLAENINVNKAIVEAYKQGTITGRELHRLIAELSTGRKTEAEVLAVLEQAYVDSGLALRDRRREVEAAERAEMALAHAMAEERAANADTIAGFKDASGAASDYGASLERLAQMGRAALPEATANINKALEEQEEAAKAAARAFSEDFVTALNDTEGGVGFFNESLKEMSDQTFFVSNATGEQRSALADLQAEYDRAQQAITDYTIGAKGVGLSTEEVNEKVAEQQARMSELEAAMQPLVSLGGEYVTTQGEMTVNQDAINQAIFESARAADADAKQLAVLGGALGLYSEEAVDAAIKTALIQEKIDALTKDYIENGGSVQALRTEIRLFTDSLDEIPGSVATDVSVNGIDDAISRVDTLLGAFNRLPGAGGGVGAPSSGVGRDVTMAQGGSFVVGGGGGTDSQLVAFRATPGEVVDVRRPDQVNNSNSLSVTQNFVGSPPNVRQEARDGVMEAARAIGLRGYA